MEPLIRLLWFLLVGVGYLVSLEVVSAAAAPGELIPKLTSKHEDLGRWQAVLPEESSPDIQVLYALATSETDGKQLVMINWGEHAGLRRGEILKSFRQGLAADGREMFRVETGQLKVKEVGVDNAIVEVIQNGSTLSASVFPEHPGVMAGDKLERQRYQVARKKQFLPQLVLTYHQLFQDPKAVPFTFELTREGQEKLREASQVFMDKKFTLLLVKGYTDRHGPSEVNQVESYQRALTIRQFLIEHLGFDRERVVALGLGETDPADESKVEGASLRNRRIVLQVITSQ